MVYDESNGHVTDQSIRYDTIRYGIKV